MRHEHERKRDIFANPFFVIMMGASVVFVLTVLAYLVSGFVLEPAGAADSPLLLPDPARHPPGRASIAFAQWLDRNAPLALAIEFGVMLVSGVVAMATDPWFSTKSKPQVPQ